MIQGNFIQDLKVSILRSGLVAILVLTVLQPQASLLFYNFNDIFVIFKNVYSHISDPRNFVWKFKWDSILMCIC